jgi:predicted 3-demethylubiquinone-9 3-methyltransferase (glyoxalase superfamily)
LTLIENEPAKAFVEELNCQVYADTQRNMDSLWKKWKSQGQLEGLAIV